MLKILFCPNEKLHQIIYFHITTILLSSVFTNSSPETLLQTPTTVVRNYWNNYEKLYCFGSHKQCKTLFNDHMVSLKIISLYIYKDLRLKILGLMSHVTIITGMAT